MEYINNNINNLENTMLNSTDNNIGVEASINSINISYMSTDEEQEQEQDIFMRNKVFMMGTGDLIIGENPGKRRSCYSELGKDYFLELKKDGSTYLAGKKVFSLKKLVIFKCKENDKNEINNDILNKRIFNIH